jgi:lipoate-protein ligase A
MALDEAIAVSVRKTGVPPTLRLYGWDRASLSLGYFQKTSGVNTDYCARHDIPIVRRPTGGRAILHEKEITYSVSVRTDVPAFSKSLLESYQQISRVFIRAFKKMHIPAYARQEREQGKVLTGSPLCFRSSSYGEIRIGRKKVVGSAQRRWPHGLLQQGSIPIRVNHGALRQIFGQGEADTLKDGIGALQEIQPGLSEAALKEAIAESFEQEFGIRLVRSHPTPDETLLAERLEEQKYSQDQWNLRR